MACIYIGVGSNIDRERHLKSGLQSLQLAFQACRPSSVYESAAFGFEGDPFYNLVIEAETLLSVADVCAQLRTIEYAHGRPANAQKFSGRTLDLDLLAYDQRICEEPVVLPRQEIVENAFVLRPFAELAPDWIHPQALKCLADLWLTFDKNKQPLQQVPFCWAD